MSNRKPISKKTRFEIFKRDCFTCQYCGKSAPTVILHIDHINPVSKGGDNNLLNLITSCEECNQGKSARELNDETVISKKVNQLSELQRRREQLEMMMEWQESLLNNENDELNIAIGIWNKLLNPLTLNENGSLSIKRLIRKYGIEEVIQSMKISVEQNLKYDRDNNIVTESANKAYDCIGAICGFRKRTKLKPHMADLYYIRGILRNRLYYCSDWQAIQLLEDVYNKGISLDDLKEIALSSRNWTDWKKVMLAILEGDDE